MALNPIDLRITDRLRDHDFAVEYVAALEESIADLSFEVRALRMYGNKDCTAMADEQIAKKRAGLKCDFED